jgi:SAM-dependent methyltransferase
MTLKNLQRNWNQFGKEDPLWAIVTHDDRKGNKWNPDEFFDTGRQEIDSVLSQIRARQISIPKGAALDFGCGVGRLTQALADHFDEAVGVDIAPSMIKLAKQYNRHGSRCTYYLNAANHLRLFKNNQFAFIYSNIVLQHMAREFSSVYIREFLRVLQPGGVLEFQLPSEQIIPFETTSTWQPPEHEPLPAWRKLVKACLPEVVLEGYRNIRDGLQPQDPPTMEMHCTPREDVEALLKASGGTVMSVREDGCGGPRFISLRYTVTKV